MCRTREWRDCMDAEKRPPLTQGKEPESATSYPLPCVSGGGFGRGGLKPLISSKQQNLVLNFLESISQTPLVRWAAESDWGYPIVLTTHAIGMGLVVGILLMFDLRVLGVAARIPISAIRSYFRVAWFGLAINVCSGTLLFFINYTAFLHNTAFLTKISLLVLAGFGTWLLAREVSVANVVTTRRARVLAGVCVLLWLGAIVAGRIVGYTSVPE